MLLTSLSVILGGPGCRSVRPAANPPVADADSLPSPPDVGWPARISNPPRRNPVDGRIPDHPDGIGVERADGSPITMEFVGLHPHGEVWAFGEDETGLDPEFRLHFYRTRPSEAVLKCREATPPSRAGLQWPGHCAFGPWLRARKATSTGSEYCSL